MQIRQVDFACLGVVRERERRRLLAAVRELTSCGATQVWGGGGHGVSCPCLGITLSCLVLDSRIFVIMVQVHIRAAEDLRRREGGGGGGGRGGGERRSLPRSLLLKMVRLRLRNEVAVKKANV